MPAVDFKTLGPRICIIGPSNSGKSTLADFIGKKTGSKIVHLDQLAHEPHTNWQRRKNAEFIADHDAAIGGDSWVMDGNYSLCMPQRFERATAVIWLDPPLMGCMLRYIMRSLKNDGRRVGKLEGAQKEFSIALVKYTLLNYPKNKIKYMKLLEQFDGVLIKINSMKDLDYSILKT